MFRKYSSVFLVALAVLLVLSFSVVAAQDIPRGGTVVVEQAGRGAWVSNFNPLISTTVSDGTLNIIYDPLVVFNPLDGGQADPLAGDRIHIFRRCQVSHFHAARWRQVERRRTLHR